MHCFVVEEPNIIIRCTKNNIALVNLRVYLTLNKSILDQGLEIEKMLQYCKDLGINNAASSMKIDREEILSSFERDKKD
jgi:hypothetical protein